MERSIDTFELARAGGELSGESPVAAMDRLASLLADAEGRIAWRLRGWRVRRPDGGADDFMALTAAATLPMSCVRCLRPVPVEVSIEREYRLVASEDEAERIDLDDALHDVLAGGRRFDLVGLIEDEAIMALPVTPRHARCELPATPRAEAPEEPPRPGPFAGLARLKNGSQKTDIIED